MFSGASSCGCSHLQLVVEVLWSLTSASAGHVSTGLGFRKDLACNMRGKNDKSGTGNLGRKTEHNINHGSLSFSVREAKRPRLTYGT